MMNIDLLNECMLASLLHDKPFLVFDDCINKMSDFSINHVGKEGIELLPKDEIIDSNYRERIFESMLEDVHKRIFNLKRENKN